MSQISVSSPQGNESGTIYERDFVTCQTKRTWAADWHEEAYLWPAWWRDSAPPALSQAELHIRYGNLKREDANAFAVEAPAEYVDLYVRIQVTNSKGTRTAWVGIITGQAYGMEGTTGADPSGEIVMAAYGLEHLLDREHIEGAWADQGLATMNIGTEPTFNRRRKVGLGLSGNRSNEKTDVSGRAAAHTFSTDGAVWTNRDIAEYLLAYYGPGGPMFQLTGQADTLAYFTTIHRLAGKTVFQALNHLISRRRSVGWRVATTGEGTIGIEVFSLLGEAISVGNVEIPANDNQISVTLDQSIAYEEAVVELGASIQYDRVVVRGEPVVVAFTVSHADATLEPAWTAAEETAYKAGDTTADASDDLAHDRERATAKHARVYQMFRIPPAWDWAAGNGIGGMKYNVAKAFTADGQLNEMVKADYWNAGRRLLPCLPIEKPALADDAEPEFMQPVVIIRDADGHYHDLLHLDPEQSTYSPAKFRRTDAEFGFKLEPGVNHKLALNHFDPSAVAAKTGTEPQFDHEQLIVTVAVETDHRLQVTADRPTGEAHEALRVLTLDLPDACYWYITPGTVTGITNGKLVHRHTDFVIRDDSERLRQIAALASAYYSRKRARIQIKAKGFWELANIGTYITEVPWGPYEEPVGAVVTSRLYTNSEERTTAMETGYAELDIGGLVDVPGLSDLRSVGRTVLGHQAQIEEIRRDLAAPPEREHTPLTKPRWRGQIVARTPSGGWVPQDANVYGVKRLRSADTSGTSADGITNEFDTDHPVAHVMATNDGEAPDEHGLNEVVTADDPGRVIVEVSEVRDKGDPPARRYYFRRGLGGIFRPTTVGYVTFGAAQGVGAPYIYYSAASPAVVEFERRAFFKFQSPVYYGDIRWMLLRPYMVVIEQTHPNSTGRTIRCWPIYKWVTEDFDPASLAWGAEPAVTAAQTGPSYSNEADPVASTGLYGLNDVTDPSSSGKITAQWLKYTDIYTTYEGLLYGVRIQLALGKSAGDTFYDSNSRFRLAPELFYTTSDLGLST